MGMPNMGGMPADAGPAKRRIKTDVKLPMLNWVALPHSKIQGTVFAEIDDDELQDEADFAEFEASPFSGGELTCICVGTHAMCMAPFDEAHVPCLRPLQFFGTRAVCVVPTHHLPVKCAVVDTQCGVRLHPDPMMGTY